MSAKNTLSKKWLPQLLPNFGAGVHPKWEELIRFLSEWLISLKADGGRLEIASDGTVVGRSLKKIKSLHIQRMAENLALVYNFVGIIEAEFYSHEMTFAEIMHFFRSEDVTSDKSISKYQKLWNRTKGGTVAIYKRVEYQMDELSPEQLKEATIWEFPGRTVEWLTTWHDSLKFHIFDKVDPNNLAQTKRDRALSLFTDNGYKSGRFFTDDAVLTAQFNFPDSDTIDRLYQMYDQAIMDGWEGLVVVRADSTYKTGRETIKNNQMYKMKDDKKEHDGQVIGVIESTVAKEGAEKTVNELGRSRTSQLAEDRTPSGMAGNFKVRMDDGRELKVQMNGFDHAARTQVLQNPELYIGKWLIFTAMDPVSSKSHALPRQAQFKSWRDGK